MANFTVTMDDGTSYSVEADSEDLAQQQAIQTHGESAPAPIGTSPYPSRGTSLSDLVTGQQPPPISDEDLIASDIVTGGARGISPLESRGYIPRAETPAGRQLANRFLAIATGAAALPIAAAALPTAAAASPLLFAAGALGAGQAIGQTASEGIQSLTQGAVPEGAAGRIASEGVGGVAGGLIGGAIGRGLGWAGGKLWARTHPEEIARRVQESLRITSERILNKFRISQYVSPTDAGVAARGAVDEAFQVIKTPTDNAFKIVRAGAAHVTEDMAPLRDAAQEVILKARAIGVPAPEAVEKLARLGVREVTEQVPTGFIDALGQPITNPVTRLVSEPVPYPVLDEARIAFREAIPAYRTLAEKTGQYSDAMFNRLNGVVHEMLEKMADSAGMGTAYRAAYARWKDEVLPVQKIIDAVRRETASPEKIIDILIKAKSPERLAVLKAMPDEMQRLVQSGYMTKLFEKHTGGQVGSEAAVMKLTNFGRAGQEFAALGEEVQNAAFGELHAEAWRVFFNVAGTSRKQLEKVLFNSPGAEANQRLLEVTQEMIRTTGISAGVGGVLGYRYGGPEGARKGVIAGLGIRLLAPRLITRALQNPQIARYIVQPNPIDAALRDRVMGIVGAIATPRALLPFSIQVPPSHQPNPFSLFAPPTPSPRAEEPFTPDANETAQAAIRG